LIFDNHGKLFVLDTVTSAIFPIEIGVSATEPAVSR
jgi:hypothetical protein